MRIERRKRSGVRLLALTLIFACDAKDQDSGDQGFGPDHPGEADADADTDTDTDTDTDGDADVDFDPSEDCHPDIADWPEAWQALEDEVVALVNLSRSAGTNCGSYGNYPPAGPLVMDPHIQCACRYHSLWMADNNSLSHESPGGALGFSFSERMVNAGFTGTPIGENVAAGYPNAAQVVQGWLSSDGHCANLMNSSATLTGVGYAPGGSYGTWWTQEFGR